MREFTNLLVEPLRNGLRPDSRALRGTLFLDEATFVEATPFGLESPSLVIDPFNGAKVGSWPFPQLIRGKALTLLGFADAVHTVNESLWTSTAIDLVDLAGDPETLAGSGYWHMADAGPAWYLFNGTDVVFRTGISRQAGVATDAATYAQSDITITTGCAHRGRIICGGFNFADGLGSLLDAILTAWEGDLPAWNEVTSQGLGPNFVAWSSIGGGDIPLWLINPDAYSDELQVNADFVLQRMRQNEFGFMAMSFQGRVLRVLPLGGSVIVYGEDGISALTLQGGYYGERLLLPFGIAGRAAAFGDDNEHLLLSEKGELWKIRADLSFTRLDYSEHLASMLDADPVIALDSRQRKFYISSSEGGYVLTRVGERSALTRHPQSVTSLVNVQGGDVGLFEQAEETEATVVSAMLDFGLRSIKTVTGIALGVDSARTLSVALDYRYNKGDAWKRTTFKPVNKEGNAYIRASGTEFRVVIRCANYDDFALDYVHVRWQSSDKRALRGPVAAAPDSEI